jgi:hypothetical protein
VSLIAVQTLMKELMNLLPMTGFLFCYQFNFLLE